VVPIYTLLVDVLVQLIPFAQPALLVVLAPFKPQHAHLHRTLCVLPAVHAVPGSTRPVVALAHQIPNARRVLLVPLPPIKPLPVHRLQTPCASHAVQAALLVNGKTQDSVVVPIADAEPVLLVALVPIKRRHVLPQPILFAQPA
jgi:hypothetical protein